MGILGGIFFRTLFPHPRFPMTELQIVTGGKNQFVIPFRLVIIQLSSD